MRSRATSALSDNAESVRVVNHHCGAVLLRQAADLRQVGDIAAHREHAVGNYQYACCLGDLLKGLFEILHIVVLIAHHSTVAELAAVVYAGVVLTVAYYIVASAYYRADDAEV